MNERCVELIELIPGFGVQAEIVATSAVGGAFSLNARAAAVQG